jgi:hypothetical protein
VKTQAIMSMSQAADDLRKARKTLVDMRHQWAKALATGHQRGDTATAIKAIIEVQQAIDAMDRALIEEAD